MFHGPVCDLNQLFQTIHSIHIQYPTTDNQPKTNTKDKRSKAINFYHKNVLKFLLFAVAPAFAQFTQLEYVIKRFGVSVSSEMNAFDSKLIFVSIKRLAFSYRNECHYC